MEQENSEETFIFIPPVSSPMPLDKEVTERHRLICYALNICIMVTGTIMVLFSIVHPVMVGSATAQVDSINPIVTDGRLVRVEQKAENQSEKIHDIELAITTINSDLKLQSSQITRLSAQVEGAERLIKFGGSIVALLAGLATWFTRKKP